MAAALRASEERLRVTMGTDTTVAKNVIRVIKIERGNRLAHLEKEDPEVARALWIGDDEPFINELCLMLLVAIHHHVERELTRLAARVTSDQRELEAEQYEQKLEEERKRLRVRGRE